MHTTSCQQAIWLKHLMDAELSTQCLCYTYKYSAKRRHYEDEGALLEEFRLSKSQLVLVRPRSDTACWPYRCTNF